MLEPITLTAPSSWASWLINGDATDLSMADYEMSGEWLDRIGLGFPVSAEDAGFIWNHDAFKECPFGADCQTYTFLVSRD